MKNSTQGASITQLIFSGKVIPSLLILLFLASLSSFIMFNKHDKNGLSKPDAIQNQITLNGVDNSRVEIIKNVTFQLGEACFDQGNVLVVNKNYFKEHGIRFIIGDPNTAFKDPHSIVVTERIANLVYSGKLAECQLIRCGSEHYNCEVKITGVIANIQDPSGLDVGYLVPAALFEEFHPRIQ